MATGTAGNTAFRNASQTISFKRKSVSFADGQTATGSLGYLRSGTLILKPISGIHVTTVWNNGTNNLLHIGVSGNTDLFGTSLSLTAANFIPLDETIGGYLLDADTEIVYEFACSGTAATTGAGEIVIAFIADNDA